MTYGAQAGVGKSHKGNEALIGSPAMDIKGYFKSYAIFKNLPHFKKRIEELEEKIVNFPTL
jgi:UDP-3-O-[3-hydroxymyristoyl] glucosamine N-acyltransferase